MRFGCTSLRETADILATVRWLDKIETMDDVWLLQLNVAKCNCVGYERKPIQSYCYTMADETLHKPDSVKDLWIKLIYS